MSEACCIKRFKLSRIAVCKNQGIYHFHGDQTLNKTQIKRSIKKVLPSGWSLSMWCFSSHPQKEGQGLLEILNCLQDRITVCVSVHCLSPSGIWARLQPPWKMMNGQFLTLNKKKYKVGEVTVSYIVQSVNIKTKKNHFYWIHQYLERKGQSNFLLSLYKFP